LRKRRPEEKKSREVKSKKLHRTFFLKGRNSGKNVNLAAKICHEVETRTTVCRAFRTSIWEKEKGGEHDWRLKIKKTPSAIGFGLKISEFSEVGLERWEKKVPPTKEAQEKKGGAKGGEKGKNEEGNKTTSGKEWPKSFRKPKKRSKKASQWKN